MVSPAVPPWRLHHGGPWLAVALVTLLGLLAPEWCERAAPSVFLASALVLGLPHGAADPWVPQWAARRVWRPLQWAAFLCLYLLVVGGTLAVWHWQRAAAALGFLALTAWHWGSADAITLAPSGKRWAALAVGRGLIVVAGPLALQPAGSRATLEALAGTAGGGASLVGEILAWAGPLLGVGVLLEAVTLSNLAVENVHRPGAWRAPCWHGLETALLVGMFRVLPPAASVGVYFVAFHAWRHVERLSALRAAAEDTPAAAVGPARRVLAFYRQVWPLALAALVMLPGLHHLLGDTFAGGGGSDWLTAYLILLSALTVPHAALIAWLDRHESSARAAATRAPATRFADTALR